MFLESALHDVKHTCTLYNASMYIIMFYSFVGGAFFL